MKHLLSALLAVALVAGARADSFDDYTNVHLKKLLGSKDVEKTQQLTLDDLVTASDVLPGLRSAFLIVRTNEGRLAKLLVQRAQQKVGEDKFFPIVLVDRFVTFKEGEERAIATDGKNVRLFDDFRLSLDIGQVVPAAVPADLRFHVEPGKTYLEPLGKAELYLVTKHLAEAAPPKGGKVAVGEKFQPRYFEGVYKLHDDGKRTGELHLKVDAKGNVAGFFFSDKDGAKYDVDGQVSAAAANNIQFRVTYPRTVQFFTGWMFTGDAQTITGFSRIEDREAGFYAVRRPD